MDDGGILVLSATARRKAVEAAIRQHDRMLVRWLTQKFGDPETARDIAQSAYLRVWRHAETEPVLNAQALIFKTAANLAANEFRARKRARLVRIEGAADGGDALREVASGLPDPEAELRSKQELKAGMAAIENLPKNARRAFILSRFEERSYREIAIELGVSESSVEKYIILALKVLRGALSGERAPVAAESVGASAAESAVVIPINVKQVVK